MATKTAKAPVKKVAKNVEVLTLEITTWLEAPAEALEVAEVKTPKLWTKEMMLEAMETKYNPQSLLRLIKVIYDRQTADEKAIGATKESNGMGFTGADAAYATSVYDRAMKRLPTPCLTEKEYVAMLRVMKKYSGQLCAVRNGWGK
jgi:hypothetical protein